MGKTAIEGARRGTVFYVDPNILVIIGIDTDDGPEHPLWDVTARTTEIERPMVDNIKTYGVFENILAVKEADGRLVVDDGRRRILHARIARKEQERAGEVLVEVPVVLIRGDDATKMGIMISANEHRRGDDPITKAQKAARAMRLTGKSEAEAAADFGVTTQTLKTWLRLLEADPRVKKAVTEGVISDTAAGHLAKLPKPEQAAALVGAVETAKADGHKRVTVDRARAVANKTAGREENVGISSRKVLKQLRATYQEEPPQGKEEAIYAQGVLDTLAIVLGDDKPTGDVVKRAKKIAKKLEREAAP